MAKTLQEARDAVTDALVAAAEAGDAFDAKALAEALVALHQDVLGG